MGLLTSAISFAVPLKMLLMQHPADDLILWRLALQPVLQLVVVVQAKLASTNNEITSVARHGTPASFTPHCSRTT